MSLTLSVLMPLGAGMVAFSSPAGADITAVKGSAYGYQAQISIFGGVQPHDGPTPNVTLPPGGTATAPSGLVRHGPATFFTSDALNVSSQGTTGAGGSVTSSSDVINVNRSLTQPTLTGSEIFYADDVHSTCTASDSGISGSTTFTNALLQIDSGDDVAGDVHSVVNVPVASNPPASPPGALQNPPPPPQDPNLPNRGHIHVNGSVDYFHVVFNEQITNPDGSLTVNAVHEFLDGPTAIGELIIGQSVCGVTRSTTTTLTSSTNPSVSGQSVTFTATVAPGAGPGTPTGTVQFKDNGTNMGGPVTLVAGQATSAPTTSLSVGSHTVTAVYGGTVGFAGSTGTVTQTVNKAITTTAVTSSKNPAGLVTQVTFTATVSPVAPGGGTPTGTVQFKNGSANLGSPVALSGGKASTTALGASLGLGAHAITAVYSGSTNFTGSISPVLNETIGVT